MDKTKQKRKLTIFRYALRYTNEITPEQVERLCKTIWGMLETIQMNTIKQTEINDWIYKLYGDLSDSIECAETLLMILRELHAWLKESNLQNEITKEESKNE